MQISVGSEFSFAQIRQSTVFKGESISEALKLYEQFGSKGTLSMQIIGF